MTGGAPSETALRDLVFVGDVHLDAGDPHLDPFLRFLDGLADTAGRIVLMGDLFNLWIGQRELEQPHQRRVVQKFEELRRKGLVVRYVEGNRDYRIGPCYAGTAFDDVTPDGLTETWGGKRLWAVHGDLANPSDRQYRAWRKLSRSALFWMLFNLLPRRSRMRRAEALERRMRSSNLGFKREFPEEQVRRYAEAPLAAGHDAVVLGHFHVEKDLRLVPPGPPGRVLVLPEWRESRRHLRVGPTGETSFVDS